MSLASRPRNLASLLVLCLISSAFAQPAQPPAGPGGNLTIQENVAQAFRVEPVVQRFTGRRGEIVPFEFTLTSLGKNTRVEVIPVNMKQELSGVILPDTDAKPPEGMRIITETAFSLGQGSSETLKGEITVPISKTNFLSYGLLVREITVQDEFKPIATVGKTQASVKFVTQYLLRIDLETEAALERDMKSLKLEDAGLRAVDGLPMFQTMLVNPTNLAFECRVAASLKIGDSPAQKPVHLVMRTRAGLEGDERTLVKIMPHSKLLLSGPPDDAIAPGEASLAVSLLNGRREIDRVEQSLSIALDQFPVLQTKFTDLGERLIASPAALILSQTKGGKHSLPLTFANRGDDKRAVALEPIDLEGNRLEGVILSTENLLVTEGKRQTVRVSFKSKKDRRDCVYGYVRVSDAGGELALIPVTLAYGVLAAADLAYSPLELHRTDTASEFRVEVTNKGEGFAPLHGKLEFYDGSGTNHVAQDGYGKILKPGESLRLTFAAAALPPGDLAARLSLETFPGQRPIMLEQSFVVSDRKE